MMKIVWESEHWIFTEGEKENLDRNFSVEKEIKNGSDNNLARWVKKQMHLQVSFKALWETCPSHTQEARTKARLDPSRTYY